MVMMLSLELDILRAVNVAEQLNVGLSGRSVELRQVVLT